MNRVAPASDRPVTGARRRLEVPVYIPSTGESLGAVVTIPDASDTTVGVLLMPGHARDRVHRNGMWVKTAQILAGKGAYVLRLDYPGVGNSSGPPRMFNIDDPPSWAVTDACRFLLEHTPVRRVILIATCFGGRIVLDAAQHIAEVEAVAVIAAPTYVRKHSALSNVKSFVKRLTGRESAVPPFAAANATQQRREGGLAVRRQVSPGFERALHRFLKQGRVYFLYGTRDPMWTELSFALSKLDLPGDRYEVEVVPVEMHAFRSTAVQQLTIDRVIAWCERLLDGNGWSST